MFLSYHTLFRFSIPGDCKSAFFFSYGTHRPGDAAHRPMLRSGSSFRQNTADCDSPHRLGIGRRLWKTFLADSDQDEITVNSSLYAVRIYEKFGFIKTADPQEDSGIRCVPILYRKRDMMTDYENAISVMKE